MANVSGRVADAAYRHIASALARLAPGGRLVAITGANFARAAGVARQLRPAAGARPHRVHGGDRGLGLCQAWHDHRDAPDRHREGRQPKTPARFPDSAGVAPDVATLLAWIEQHVPARMAVTLPKLADQPAAPRTVRGYLARAASVAPARRIAQLDRRAARL